MGLTEGQLRDEFGVTNPFHRRKMVLHLDRLALEALGRNPQYRIPRRYKTTPWLGIRTAVVY